MTNESAGPFKTIIFDLGKVIVDFDHFIICRRLAQYSPYSPEQVYEIIFTAGLEDRFDRGLIAPALFYETVINELAININMDLFRKIWDNIFSLNPGIEQIIRKLKNRYELLCLSNTNQWQFDFCMQSFPVLKNFDSFVLSFEIGKKKPDKIIYKKALEQTSALPQECLYIDDIKKFTDAAEDNGIKAIQFISVQQLERELKVLEVL